MATRRDDTTAAGASGATTAADLDPRPRSVVAPFRDVDWPVGAAFILGPPVPPTPMQFTDVLEARRSIRQLSRAPLRELANLLLFATGARQAWGKSPSRSRRPSHSAGAIHPIAVIMVRAASNPRAFRLDPVAGHIELLRPVRPGRLVDLLAAARGIVPSARADIIVLAADPAATGAAYENAEALVWRDAGALMQTIHLCATAHRLGFCPLGIGGREAIEAIFGDRSRLLPAGAALVGRPDA